jgi:hypothetical protein
MSETSRHLACASSRSSRGAVIASNRLPDCSAAASALSTAGTRIVRGDDYAPDACRKRASRGVSSGRHPRLYQISAKSVSNFELLKDVGPPRIGEERLSLNDHF